MQVCVLVAALGCVTSGILASEPRRARHTPSSSVGPPPSPPGRYAVGFSVRKAVPTNGNHTVSAPSSPLEFQNVLTNLGGGWNAYQDVFVAPVKGAYYFSFNAASTPSCNFTLALMKNNQYQVTAFGPDGYQWGGNSAFLTLRTGDRVYLNLQDGEIYVHPENEAYTTFFGFLVFKL